MQGGTSVPDIQRDDVQLDNSHRVEPLQIVPWASRPPNLCRRGCQAGGHNQKRRYRPLIVTGRNQLQPDEIVVQIVEAEGARTNGVEATAGGAIHIL
jgi:hypothetical protein